LLMKKTIFLLTILLSFSMFVSCTFDISTTPIYSDNFDEDFVSSFFQNYEIVDFQLGYLSASPCEAEIICDSHSMDIDNLKLAVIDETDIKMFVSGTQVKRTLPIGNGGFTTDTYVYQSKNAPVPMKDWTIKSISITASSWPYPKSGNGTNYKNISENMMQQHLDSSNILCVYNANMDSEFINGIKDAYLNSECIDAYEISMLEKEIRSEDQLHVADVKYYKLFITFEENSNIVWYADLYKSGSEILFICGTAEYAFDINQRYGKISDEFAEQIKELLVADGCDKFD